MNAEEGEHNVKICGSELLRTRRNKDFTVDVESQQLARRMGPKDTAAPQVVKNRHSIHHTEWDEHGMQVASCRSCNPL
jgi:hypothetical protein